MYEFYSVLVGDTAAPKCPIASGETLRKSSNLARYSPFKTFIHEALPSVARTMEHATKLQGVEILAEASFG